MPGRRMGDVVTQDTEEAVPATFDTFKEIVLNRYACDRFDPERKIPEGVLEECLALTQVQRCDFITVVENFIEPTPNATERFYRTSFAVLQAIGTSSTMPQTIANVFFD